MNDDIIKGDWKQLSGKLKRAWGKLTDDDLLRAEGDGEYLLGKLQEQYGLTREKAQESLRALGYRSQRTAREDSQTTERRNATRPGHPAQR